MLATTWAYGTACPLEDRKVHRAHVCSPLYTHSAQRTLHPQRVLGKCVCISVERRHLDSPAPVFPTAAVGSESTAGYLKDEAGPGHPGKLLGGGHFSSNPLYEGRASLILPLGSGLDLT